MRRINIPALGGLIQAYASQADRRKSENRGSKFENRNSQVEHPPSRLTTSESPAPSRQNWLRFASFQPPGPLESIRYRDFWPCIMDCFDLGIFVAPPAPHPPPARLRATSGDGEITPPVLVLCGKGARPFPGFPGTAKKEPDLYIVSEIIAYINWLTSSRLSCTAAPTPPARHFDDRVPFC